MPNINNQKEQIVKTEITRMTQYDEVNGRRILFGHYLLANVRVYISDTTYYPLRYLFVADCDDVEEFFYPETFNTDSSYHYTIKDCKEYARMHIQQMLDCCDTAEDAISLCNKSLEV